MKQDIGEFIINFINNNQNTDWEGVFKALFIFLSLFWFGISLWVYNDARSRYNKRIVAILITLFIMVFNIPALIIYVILRPEHTREEIRLIANASSSNQFLPLEIEKELLSSGKSFKMHFAINFTPSLENGKPKLNFTVENINNLSLNEDMTQRKVLAENVEVVSHEVKKEIEQEVTKENDLNSEQLKLSEQLVKQNPIENLDNKKGIKEFLDTISNKVMYFPRKALNKIRDNRQKAELKKKEKSQFKLFENVKATIKSKLTSTRPVNPTEVILPNNVSKEESTERLAKSKKKKKNRNRRR